MTRIVHCRKYDEKLPGLERAPFPGALGEDIYVNISQRAWDEWQRLQTMLINENHLSLQDAAARHYLLEQMKKFLSNKPTDRPSGYVDPNVSSNDA